MPMIKPSKAKREQQVSFARFTSSPRKPGVNGSITFIHPYTHNIFFGADKREGKGKQTFFLGDGMLC